MKGERFNFLKEAKLGNFLFVLVLFLGVGKYALQNIATADAAIRNSGGLKAENLNNIEQQFKENIADRNRLIDLYGSSLNALQKSMVGNFEFLKDKNGIVHMVQDPQPTDEFYKSACALKELLKQKDIPAVYLLEPDHTGGLPLAQQIKLNGHRNTDFIEKLKTAGIDVLDMEEIMSVDNAAPSREEFFFHTDVHYSTYGEFWMSRYLARWLSETYGIVFPNADQVFEKQNYSILPYDFLGNTSRSVGKYFAGIDRFENYVPNFQTDLTLVDYTGAPIRNGDFQSVVMNGYENNPDADLYTYWVTNYGQYPNAYYEYQNHLSPDAPRLLMIADSTFMRGTAFLALACEKVTVIDIRYANDVSYVEQALSKNQYDAVVFCGTDILRFGFMNTATLPDLPEEPAQTADYWIGVEGVCIDTCNGNPVGESETILVSADAQQIELVGWAADFNARKPLSALYLQIGEHIVQCDYGIERTSVSDHYGIPDLTNTGFTVVFPTAYLQENQTGVMQLIQISADGASRYEPVERRIALPPVPLAEHKAQMLESHWEGSEAVFTMKNTSGAVWTEKELIRAGIFSNGNDTGLRGYLQPETAVQPGETAVFRISLAGREELFSTELEAVMLQETVCYFEERGKIGAPDR